MKLPIQAKPIIRDGASSEVLKGSVELSLLHGTCYASKDCSGRILSRWCVQPHCFHNYGGSGKSWLAPDGRCVNNR